MPQSSKEKAIKGKTQESEFETLINEAIKIPGTVITKSLFNLVILLPKKLNIEIKLTKQTYP